MLITKATQTLFQNV